MEENSDEQESQSFIRQFPKQSCFEVKRKLEENPSNKLFIEILLGIFIITQLWIWFGIVYNCWDSKELARPIGFLAIILLEIFVVCIFSLCSIFNDLYSHRINGITLWKRQAIGRLIRNLLIFLLIESTLIILYCKIDNKPLKLLGSAAPLLFLSVVVFLRYLLVKAEYNLFWLSSAFLFLLQEILLVLKIDYSIGVSWKDLLLPVYFECFLLVLSSAFVVYENRSEAFSCVLAIFTCSGFSTVLCGIGLYLLLNLDYYSFVLVCAGFAMVSVGVLHIIGSFFLDLAIGHVEIENFSVKHSISGLIAAPHSV